MSYVGLGENVMQSDIHPTQLAQLERYLPWLSKRLGLMKTSRLKNTVRSILADRDEMSFLHEWSLCKIPLGQVETVCSEIAEYLEWPNSFFYPTDECQYILLTDDLSFAGLEIQTRVEQKTGLCFQIPRHDIVKVQLLDLFPLQERAQTVGVSHGVPMANE